MSMIEEQIKELEQAKYGVLDRNTIDKLLNGAINTITELSAKLHAAQMERSSQYYNSGWIPVNERTPTEPGKYYIVSAVEGKRQHVTFAKWQVKLKKFDMAGARSYWKAIAWQPLPNPYEPKDNEGS